MQAPTHPHGMSSPVVQNYHVGRRAPSMQLAKKRNEPIPIARQPTGRGTLTEREEERSIHTRHTNKQQPHQLSASDVLPVGAVDPPPLGVTVASESHCHCRPPSRWPPTPPTQPVAGVTAAAAAATAAAVPPAPLSHPQATPLAINVNYYIWVFDVCGVPLSLPTTQIDPSQVTHGQPQQVHAIGLSQLSSGTAAAADSTAHGTHHQPYTIPTHSDTQPQGPTIPLAKAQSIRPEVQEWTENRPHQIDGDDMRHVMVKSSGRSSSDSPSRLAVDQLQSSPILIDKEQRVSVASHPITAIGSADPVTVMSPVQNPVPTHTSSGGQKRKQESYSSTKKNRPSSPLTNKNQLNRKPAMSSLFGSKHVNPNRALAVTSQYGSIEQDIRPVAPMSPPMRAAAAVDTRKRAIPSSTAHLHKPAVVQPAVKHAMAAPTKPTDTQQHGNASVRPIASNRSSDTVRWRQPVTAADDHQPPESKKGKHQHEVTISPPPLRREPPTEMCLNTALRRVTPSVRVSGHQPIQPDQLQSRIVNLPPQPAKRMLTSEVESITAIAHRHDAHAPGSNRKPRRRLRVPVHADSDEDGEKSHDEKQKPKHPTPLTEVPTPPDPASVPALPLVGDPPAVCRSGPNAGHITVTNQPASQRVASRDESRGPPTLESHSLQPNKKKVKRDGQVTELLESIKLMESTNASRPASSSMGLGEYEHADSSTDEPANPASRKRRRLQIPAYTEDEDHLPRVAALIPPRVLPGLDSPPGIANPCHHDEKEESKQCTPSNQVTTPTGTASVPALPTLTEPLTVARSGSNAMLRRISVANQSVPNRVEPDADPNRPRHRELAKKRKAARADTVSEHEPKNSIESASTSRPASSSMSLGEYDHVDTLIDEHPKPASRNRLRSRSPASSEDEDESRGSALPSALDDGELIGVSLSCLSEPQSLLTRSARECHYLHHRIRQWEEALERHVSMKHTAMSREERGQLIQSLLPSFDSIIPTETTPPRSLGDFNGPFVFKNDSRMRKRNLTDAFHSSHAYHLRRSFLAKSVPDEIRQRMQSMPDSLPSEITISGADNKSCKKVTVDQKHLKWVLEAS